MPASDVHGLPLLDAIRQYSDQDTWDEFEQSLGLTPPKDRVAWTNDDRATYNFQISLKLDAIQTRMSHGDVRLGDLKIQNLWAKLKNRFRSRLQSGELLATGYVEPVDIGAGRTSIPPDKWPFLELDFRGSRAEYKQLKLVHVQVLETKPTTSLANAEAACRDWLHNESQQIFKTVEPFNKQNVFDEASRHFTGLSRRAFDRAWASSVSNEWKKPGAKPKKKSVH